MAVGGAFEFHQDVGFAERFVELVRSVGRESSSGCESVAEFLDSFASCLTTCPAIARQFAAAGGGAGGAAYLASILPTDRHLWIWLDMADAQLAALAGCGGGKQQQSSSSTKNFDASDAFQWVLRELVYSVACRCSTLEEIESELGHVIEPLLLLDRAGGGGHEADEGLA